MFESIKRHWKVAREAYALEKKSVAGKLPIHQKDFLPAALSVMEKPASPAGRFFIWLIVILFSTAILWSFFGKIDEVAIAQGSIVTRGQTKVIQSIQPGLVLDIYVDNGSQVKKGDVLIELDATNSYADVTRLKREYQTASLLRLRSEWILKEIDKDSAQLASELLLPSSIDEKVISIQKMFAESQLNEYRATQSAYQQQLEEKKSELSVVKRQLNKLVETLPLLEEQEAGMAKLSKEGIAARFQYLEYQERLLGRRKDLVIEQDRVLQVKASIRTVEKQREQQQEEFRKKLVSDLAEATDIQISVEQELKKAEQTNKLQRLRAPVDGVVQQLAIHTIGGVVSAGDALMVVVPAERYLEVEAKILNRDIGFVSEGQEVEVKLEAFPFTKYGVVHGTITSIDLAAVQDEELGLVYPTRISIEKSSVMVHGKEVQLVPGMSLSAELKTGKRRLIEFFFAPLLRYKDESLRER
ncbi:MAG: HlyD family type I secretion periplasmic adaptor subunit [Cellvibrionaceae bacterium]